MKTTAEFSADEEVPRARVALLLRPLRHLDRRHAAPVARRDAARLPTSDPSRRTTPGTRRRRTPRDGTPRPRRRARRALRTNRGADAARLVAFDLLHIDGEDRRKLPLEVRRAELESLVAGIDAIVFSEAIEAEGAVVFEKACEMNLEGIVSKRLGSPYSSGRVRNWVKVKNPDFWRR